MAVASQSFSLISLHGCLFNRANVHTNDSLSIQHQVKTLTFVLGTSEVSTFNFYQAHLGIPKKSFCSVSISHTSVHQPAILATRQIHRHISGSHMSGFTLVLPACWRGANTTHCSCTHQISRPVIMAKGCT